MNILVHFSPHMRAFKGFAIIALSGLVGLIISTIWIYRMMVRRRQYLLGYLGERAVGEYLGRLEREYQVFHDVPVNDCKKPFNLDHVVVGPRGVSLIETKTRRKGRARAGRSPTEVIFNGIALTWPWTKNGDSDEGPVRQAALEASWLQNWIFQRTGISTAVRPILALPGWYTKGEGDFPIKVVNEQRIWLYLDHGRDVLTRDETVRIANELDKICRDVVD